jgi:hypothetical protein
MEIRLIKVRILWGQTNGRGSVDIGSVCDTVEEEEADPFCPAGVDPLEVPNNLMPDVRSP